jgi:aspartyl-tRNA(Asn)/glutamyl-tRNA(Gln) amidotransferase subunit B
MTFKPTIGLEIHVQLNTQSKLFSNSINQFGAKANTQVSFVDAAMPGTLPTINIEAVKLASLFGQAVGAQIIQDSVFERKHYFYPDSPHGYQISQNLKPIVKGGVVKATIKDKKSKEYGQSRDFQIHHAHLEADAGKSVHNFYHGMTGIDLNRAGTPLIEIVSEPCIKSIDEAVAYAKEIYQIVCFYGICDGNLQEGSFRIDANISVSETESLGTRCEIKNLNSFKFLKDALTFEMGRQIELLEDGGKVIQQTRLYDDSTGQTFAMRDKEDAQDYRYFPEPDLKYVHIPQYILEYVHSTIDKPFRQIKEALQVEFELTLESLDIILEQKHLYTLLTECGLKIQNADKALLGKVVAFWIPEVMSKKSITMSELNINAENLAQIIQSQLPTQMIKTLIEKNLTTEALSEEIEAMKQGQSKGNEEVLTFINALMTEHTSEVAQYLEGKTKVLSFFVGKIMKQFKGQIDAQVVNTSLKEALEAQKSQSTKFKM